MVSEREKQGSAARAGTDADGYRLLDDAQAVPPPYGGRYQQATERKIGCVVACTFQDDGGRKTAAIAAEERGGGSALAGLHPADELEQRALVRRRPEPARRGETPTGQQAMRHEPYQDRQPAA